MAKKHFSETEEGYFAVLSHSTGGRVMGTLWETRVNFDKDLNIIDVSSTMTDKNIVNKEVEELKKYVKNQLAKVGNGTGKFLVRDHYGCGVCIKEVKLKSDGTPNLKEAGTRLSVNDLIPLTQKIEDEFNATKAMKQEIQELEVKLSKMKSDYNASLEKIFKEN